MATACLRAVLGIGTNWLALRLIGAQGEFGIGREAAGTAQSVVSRIESGCLNPTMDMVARLAEAMHSEPRLTIESR